MKHYYTHEDGVELDRLLRKSDGDNNELIDKVRELEAENARLKQIVIRATCCGCGTQIEEGETRAMDIHGRVYCEVCR